MGRSRSRSRSRSRDSPEHGDKDRAGGRDRRDPPTQCSLLVRNLSRSVTVEDLRYHAEKYGPLRDIYIPRNYYTKEPRGIAFVEYTSSRDCEDAKYSMDRMNLGGREIGVVYAQHGRKRPETFTKEARGGGGGGGYDRGGSGGGYDRGGYGRSRGSDRGRDRDRRRSRSRSRDRSRSRERDRSQSRERSDDRRRSRGHERDRPRSVSRSRSPEAAAKHKSRSPSRGRSASPERKDRDDRD